MGDDKVVFGLSVERVPIAIGGGVDGDKARVVALGLVAQDEEHLTGVASKLILCHTHDAVGFGLAIHHAVEHHHTRQLKGVVQARDIPLIGLVGDGSSIDSRQVTRHAIVLKHWLIIFVVEHRA